jgi:hypothetical protein
MPGSVQYRRLCCTSGGNDRLAEQDAVAEEGEPRSSVHLPWGLPNEANVLCYGTSSYD